MLNVFVAIGGSGTKVAEALVRLLALGFPTKAENRDGVVTLTSAGDDLEIWRLDPDRSAGAADSLRKALDEYQQLQRWVTRSTEPGNWAMDVSPDIGHLDPLNLPGQGGDSQRTKLRGILDSQDANRHRSTPFLDLLYDDEDLDIDVDRGFYQKPFIGAPLMAIFAESLKDPNSPGGKVCKLSYLETKEVQFFLCGSLHGGTGASGLPVLGKFLGEWRRDNPGLKWSLGGCLLAPYTVPPAPPFAKLDDPSKFHSSVVDSYLRDYASQEPFSRMSNDDSKRELIKQILLGFYAHPDDLTTRARHSLVYYRDHIASYFDALYLLGKPQPDQLEYWSNGGATQQNPLNSAEVAAAMTALSFFSKTSDGRSADSSYVIGSSTRELNGAMRLKDLPKYTLEGGYSVDPEKVFLASSVLFALVRHQLPWGVDVVNWPKDLERIKAFYSAHPEYEDGDKISYSLALDLIIANVTAVLAPDLTSGWSGADYGELLQVISDDEHTRNRITKQLNPSLLRRTVEPLALGSSKVPIKASFLGDWCPTGNFTRGTYLRHVWSQTVAMCEGA